MTQQKLKVLSQESGERLDLFLQKRLIETSRSQIQKWIREGKIQLDSECVKSSQRLKAGSEILLDIPPPQALEVEAETIPLQILYEDSDLLVLNKSAEMVVHPGPGNRHGTLVNALLHHCQDLSGIGGSIRPGIVHRLDKGTSGILVVAKNDFTHLALSKQFADRTVKKIYQAFVWGVPKPASGVIRLALGRSMRHRQKIGVQTRKSREAVTHYQVLRAWEDVSLVELKPETGRTHQIRVHLDEIGHPVLGDKLYGRGKTRLAKLPTNLQKLVKALPFQLLHAYRLTFVHPRREQELVFEAPLREEMLQLQKSFESWIQKKL